MLRTFGKQIAREFSWSDFSGTLPDSPADTLAIDSGASPKNGTIYVGTDAGVFASSTAAPNWSEVGPASTQPGFLPNVAVTSLKLFNSGGVKRLRAASYGRGIWEWNLITTPDFQLSIANNSQQVFAGQPATYSGTMWARNGYSSSVNLACGAGSTAVPQSCLATPASVTPTAQGTNFTLSANDLAGDYSFILRATGTDPAAIVRTVPVVLHVMDFGVNAPAPGSTTLAPGTSSSPISFAVWAAGSFTGLVNFSCGGLPSGVTCRFQPSSANPSAGNPVPVTLTITASSAAALGSS